MGSIQNMRYYGFVCFKCYKKLGSDDVVLVNGDRALTELVWRFMSFRVDPEKHTIIICPMCARIFRKAVDDKLIELNGLSAIPKNSTAKQQKWDEVRYRTYRVESGILQ